MRYSPAAQTALCTLLLASSLDCTRSRQAATGSRDAKISIVDHLGRTVALTGPARRIASLSPANTETLFALGCGERVVLRDRASDFPVRVRRLPATDPFHLSADHIAGFRPDLVLLSHADGARIAAFGRLGLTAASFDPKDLLEVLSTIGAIGKLCGAPRRAAALAAALHRRIDAVRRHPRTRGKPRVYAELDGADPSRPWTAGRGSFIDELITLAGGSNIASILPRPYAQISAEAILRSDPQVILLAVDPAGRRQLAARLRTRPGWQQLAALRHGSIIDTIDADLLSRPGPRLVDGLEQLVAALHPQPSAAKYPQGARP